MKDESDAQRERIDWTNLVTVAASVLVVQALWDGNNGVAVFVELAAVTTVGVEPCSLGVTR
jgi:hypothetical protein